METTLDNLALGATSKRNIVANLIAINKKFLETNTPLVVQIKSLLATNTRLANTQGTESQKPPRATITRESIHIDLNGYSWFHGFKLRMGHSIVTCGGKL